MSNSNKSTLKTSTAAAITTLYPSRQPRARSREALAGQLAGAMAGWRKWLATEGRTTPRTLRVSDLPEDQTDTTEAHERAERVVMVRHLRAAITAIRQAGGSHADCAVLFRMIDYILRIDAGRSCPVLTTTGTNRTKSDLEWERRAMAAAALDILIEVAGQRETTKQGAKAWGMDVVSSYIKEAQAGDFGLDANEQLTAENVETWRYQLNRVGGGKRVKGVPASAADPYRHHIRAGREFQKLDVDAAEELGRALLRVACSVD